MKWWGREQSVDCSECDSSLVTDGENIKNFARELVKRIDMQPYGEPQAVHFGDGNKAGFSLVQLISTSLISGHFCDESGAAYINVFSCKDFDPKIVEEVITQFFNPKQIRSNFITRNA